MSSEEKEQQLFSQIGFFCNKINECLAILLTTNFKALAKNAGFNKNLKTTSNSHNSPHAPLSLDTLFHLNVKTLKNLYILHVKFQHKS